MPTEADPILAEHPTLGPYTLVKKLGEGGMGGVYLGKHNVLQVEHAIKIIRPRMAADPQLVERFLREARHAARLIHSNIVQVFAADVADGLYYLAMQYVAGQSLADAMSKGKLNPHRAARYIHMSAMGLAYAHKKQIIHRDIKPGNILIDEEDNAKITDFGLVRDMSADDTGQNNLTQTGLIIGTPHFMPPEQWHGEGVDHRSDIYALGVTFYHLLTRTFPYPGRNPPQILGLLMQGKPEPIKKFAPACDDDLCAVVAKSMHTDPLQRYQTALGMAQDIEKWWQAHPPSEADSALLAQGASSESVYGPGGNSKLATPTQLKSNSAFGSTSSRAAKATGPIDELQPATPGVAASSSVPTPTVAGPMVTQVSPPGSRTGLMVVLALLAIITVAVVAFVAISNNKGNANTGVVDGDGRSLATPEFELELTAGQATRDNPVFTGNVSFAINGKANVPVLLNGKPFKLGESVKLAEGENTLELAAEVGAEKASRTLFVVLDTQAPKLEVPAFAKATGGDIPTELRSFKINGNVSDLDKKSKVMVFVDDRSTPEIVVKADGSWEFALTVGSEPVKVDIRAEDRVGNKAESRQAVIVPDRELPKLTLETKSIDGVVWSTSENVELTGRINKLRGCTLTCDKSRVDVASDGTFKLSKKLVAGPSALKVELVDWLERKASLDIAVMVDLEAPLISLTSPKAGEVLRVVSFPTEVNVTGRVDDLTATLSIDGEVTKPDAKGVFKKSMRVDGPATFSLKISAVDLASRTTAVTLDFSVKLLRYKALPANEKGQLEYERLSDGMILVLVPAGSFEQGIVNGLPDAPARMVEMSSFLIGKTEVTNAQFAKYLTTAGITPADALSRELLAKDDQGAFFNLRHDGKQWMPVEGFGSQPVVGVTWTGARAYCRWADTDGGDLPSEAQWEYAARGKDSRPYPWGTEKPDGNRCNFKKGGLGGLAPVGKILRGASAFGLLDMAGNVEEWCLDWYETDNYTMMKGKDPAVLEKPQTADRRVVRGGSFISDAVSEARPTDSDGPSDLRAFQRGRRLPGSGAGDRGFRAAARFAE